MPFEKKGTLKLRCRGVSRILDKTMFYFDKWFKVSGFFVV